jgi:lysophospholipase L1-like esterase
MSTLSRLLSLTLVLAGARAEAATKVAFIGDSITAGVGASPGGGYVHDLRPMLGPNYNVGNFGHSGTTMMKGWGQSYWVVSEFMAAQAFAPDIVVIALGTNDSKEFWVQLDGPHRFEPDYRAMVAVFQGLPSKPRIVLVLPPPMVRPDLAMSQSNLKNLVIPIINKIAADTHCDVANVQDSFFPNPAQYFGAGNSIDIGDGLHPNDAGHDREARTIFCALIPGGTAADGSVKCEGMQAPLADGGAPRDSGPDQSHAVDGSVAPDAPTSAQDASPGDPDGAGPVDTQAATGGTGGTGGTSGTGGTGGTSGAGGPGPMTNLTGKSSSCAFGRSAMGSSWPLALLLAGALLRRRRA